MEINSDPSVLLETENEDDIFYAEIKRRILALTSEEDNEDLVETKNFNTFNYDTNDGSNRLIYNLNSAIIPTQNFYLWETESSDSPPVWLVNLWKNGKGTGVFIPQVSCRQNQRPGTIFIFFFYSFIELVN